MTAFAWFTAGAAVAAAVAFVLTRRRAATVPPHEPQRTPRDERPAPVPPPALTVGSRQLAVSLADELANLASGVEGRAHHLIQAIGDPAGVPRAAEALLTAVQRLRTLHTKLAAVGHGARTSGRGPTALAPLLTRLRGELQTLQLGLEVRWEPPARLPDLAVPTDEAYDALLFVCGAMLRAERGATHFAIATETSFAAAEPTLQLELVLEWSSEGKKPTTERIGDAAATLDLAASHRLVAGHGGELTLHHLPGRSVRAVVQWPLAADDVPIPAPDAPEPPPESSGPARRDHHYGGALILEADPAVRAMVASELKATGRAVFACADASSARTFLEATPDRFELLVVDHAQRLDGDDALAATIRRVAPALKLFVMAAAPADASPSWPRLHTLQKPFGVHELRAALASVLAAG